MCSWLRNTVVFFFILFLFYVFCCLYLHLSGLAGVKLLELAERLLGF